MQIPDFLDLHPNIGLKFVSHKGCILTSQYIFHQLLPTTSNPLQIPMKDDNASDRNTFCHLQQSSQCKTINRRNWKEIVKPSNNPVNKTK